jgi:DNA helicase-2/ATP-dependent DNA helicase PcrA
MIKNELAVLNESQQVAVFWDTGPLLVLAGPGSGKTKVLTLRITRLIEKYQEETFKCLALTFTTKAADEMRKRIETLTGFNNDRVVACTFHSFCADILRTHGSVLGIKSNFKILTLEEDRKQVLKDVIKQLSDKLYLDYDFESKVLPLLDLLFTNCVNDKEIEKFIFSHEITEALKIIFPAYRNELIRSNSFDYPSLLYFTESLLSSRKRLSERLKSVYRFVSVDEFQDTNLAQYRILRSIWHEKDDNIFIVADDDQIIYQWNGASPERFDSLMKDYSCQIVQLPENYRCPGEVVEIANKLIVNNKNRSFMKKPLISIKGISSETGKIRVLDFADPAEEVLEIAKDIKKIHSKQPSTVVVIGRTSKQINGVAEALRSIGVEAYTAVKKTQFESLPYALLTSLLKLKDSETDKTSLRKILLHFKQIDNFPVLDSEIILEAEARGTGYLKTLLEITPNISHKTFSIGLINLINKQLYVENDYKSFIDHYFELIKDCYSELEVDEALAAEDSQIWNEFISNINSKLESGLSLSSFLQEFDLSPKVLPPPRNAVKCLTIHASKGLEFDHVYLIGMANDILPSYQSIKRGWDSKELQEERRSCFVAITRAQKTLTFSYAKSYYGFRKQVSRFLVEMGLV